MPLLFALQACAPGTPVRAKGAASAPERRSAEQVPAATLAVPSAAGSSSAAPPRAAAAPRALLGRVPETNDYRVIACSTGPNSRAACELLVEQFVGEEVSFASGARTKLLHVVEIATGDGSRSRALELERADGPVAVFPAGALQLKLESASVQPKEAEALKRQQRKLSPKAVYATKWTFTTKAFQANLDGDGSLDRVLLGEIKDSGPTGSRYVRALWVSLSGRPFEAVEKLIQGVEVFGSVDLDGNGKDEFLLMRTEPLVDRIDYEYTLYGVVDGKRLEQVGTTPSERWQPYDRLEDHDHSDE